jgi:hypothetical protein
MKLFYILRGMFFKDFKFRVFDKETGKIYPVSVVSFFAGFISIGEPYDFDNWHVRSEGDVVIMRFAGMVDKYGRDIFEGDIVKAEGVGIPLLVMFEKGCFVLKPKEDVVVSFLLCAWKPDQLEVIGNKWENSELLEKK